MSRKFSDEWGEYEIRVNDPRGECWLYRDGARTLDIGWNHENPARGNIRLSAVKVRADQGALSPEQLARTIARFLGFMVKPGGGYSSVQVHLDAIREASSDWAAVREHLDIIDDYLARYGLRRLEGSNLEAPIWTRTAVSTSFLPPSSRHVH